MTQDQKLELIKICKIEKVYAADRKKLTWCLVDRPTLKRAVVKSMALIPGAQRKLGKGPQTFMERDLQQWLEAIAER